MSQGTGVGSRTVATASRLRTATSICPRDLRPYSPAVALGALVLPWRSDSRMKPRPAPPAALRLAGGALARVGARASVPHPVARSTLAAVPRGAPDLPQPVCRLRGVARPGSNQSARLPGVGCAWFQLDRGVSEELRTATDADGRRQRPGRRTSSSASRLTGDLQCARFHACEHRPALLPEGSRGWRKASRGSDRRPGCLAAQPARPTRVGALPRQARGAAPPEPVWKTANQTSGASERDETTAAADKHVLDASGGTAAADKHVPDASGGTAAADKHVPDASGGSLNTDLWPAKPEAQALAAQLSDLALLVIAEHRVRHQAAGEKLAAAVPTAPHGRASCCSPLSPWHDDVSAGGAVRTAACPGRPWPHSSGSWPRASARRQAATWSGQNEPCASPCGSRSTPGSRLPLTRRPGPPRPALRHRRRLDSRMPG
jgi:hypothetical protein